MVFLCTNSDDDVLKQETSYDCGVFVCMFSRALGLAGPLVLNANIMDVGRSISHDLHFQILSPMPSTGVQVGMYYAVDYVEEIILKQCNKKESLVVLSTER